MSLSTSSPFTDIQCKGVLFDMDGVLISSLGSVERSWSKWAVMRGVDPENACRIAHGCRSIETVAKLRPDLDSEEENRLIESIEMEDTQGVRVLPGVLELLSSLPSNRWTIVTSATEPLARVRLAAARVPIPRRIVTAESVSQGKPHPAPYLAGATLLGFAPKECVVFEDSEMGAEAGRAAGCTVIATTFSHPVQSLQAATHLVKDLTGMIVRRTTGAAAITLHFVPLPGTR
jgi:mannitol-1-/sugar-/sorbitol-6-phosphatase